MALMIIFSYLIVYILTLKLWFASSSHLIDRLPILYGAYDLVGSSDIDDDDVGFEV